MLGGEREFERLIIERGLPLLECRLLDDDDVPEPEDPEMHDERLAGESAGEYVAPMPCVVK